VTPDEFIKRSVGLPWIRWRSDWAAMDCFGLVVMWHREVLEVDPGEVPLTDIASGFSTARGWAQCEAEQGATCFMTWRNGAPTHCGVLVAGGMVLHAQEGYPDPHSGSVRLTRLAVFARTCPDLRFYRYEGRSKC
jgi:cell wall-associated NlpC family hydrolase